MDFLVHRLLTPADAIFILKHSMKMVTYRRLPYIEAVQRDAKSVPGVFEPGFFAGPEFVEERKIFGRLAQAGEFGGGAEVVTKAHFVGAQLFQIKTDGRRTDQDSGGVGGVGYRKMENAGIGESRFFMIFFGKLEILWSNMHTVGYGLADKSMSPGF